MEREPNLKEIEDFGEKESVQHKRIVVGVVLFLSLIISTLAFLHKI